MIMGQILAAGAGQNPARQAAVNAGIPVERTAYGVNQLCGSGLRTVALGYQAIRVGDSDVVGRGRTREHEPRRRTAMHMRNGTRMGHDRTRRHHCCATDCSMPSTATTWGIRRRTSPSGGRSPAGSRMPSPPRPRTRPRGRRRRAGFAEEIVPVTIKTRKGESIVDTDEHPKHGTTVETLAKLRPAFARGRHGDRRQNASGINDGAARGGAHDPRETPRSAGSKPLAPDRFLGHRGRGPPRSWGTGPIPASRRALEKAGWSPDDLDLVEANEAFARAGVRSEQGPGMGYRQGQRERRPRSRWGTSDRRLGSAGADDAALRDAAARARGRASPRCASAAGWASRCAWSASDRRQREEAAAMGHVAVVTGGTRGIGEAISVALRDAGHTVAATYAGNDAAARRFGERTGVRTYKFDVADLAGVPGRGGPDRQGSRGAGRDPGQQRRHHPGRKRCTACRSTSGNAVLQTKPLVLLQHVPLRDRRDARTGPSAAS